MPITPLPTPPSSADLANFDERADAFLEALPAFAGEANALAQDTNTNAQVAQQTSAQAIVAQQGATQEQAKARTFKELSFFYLKQTQNLRNTTEGLKEETRALKEQAQIFRDSLAQNVFETLIIDSQDSVYVLSEAQKKAHSYFIATGKIKKVVIGAKPQGALNAFYVQNATQNESLQVEYLNPQTNQNIYRNIVGYNNVSVFNFYHYPIFHDISLVLQTDAYGKYTNLTYPHQVKDTINHRLYWGHTNFTILVDDVRILQFKQNTKFDVNTQNPYKWTKIYNDPHWWRNDAQVTTEGDPAGWANEHILNFYASNDCSGCSQNIYVFCGNGRSGYYSYDDFYHYSWVGWDRAFFRQKPFNKIEIRTSPDDNY